MRGGQPSGMRRMRVKVGRALGAGAVAALAAVTVAGLMRWLGGVGQGPVEPLGQLILPEEWLGWAWLTGAAAHVAGGALFALIYAAVFEWVTRRGGALVGLALAVPHALVAGLALAFLPVLRPAAFTANPPGAFLEYGGVGAVVAFFVFVGVYGALVGLLYGTVERSVRAALGVRQYPARS